MAPPGRRRPGANSFSFSTLFALITLFLAFFSTSASASYAVLGIDLGTEYLKGALVKPGNPLDIVLSKDSKRKEPAAIAFKPGTSSANAGNFPERFYGSDATALSLRFPGDVYSNLKTLLGAGSSNGDQGVQISGVDEFRKRYPGLDLVTEIGAVIFRSKSFGDNKESPFRVEELLAMELKNLKENAEILAGTGHKIEDAVITIPPFYTAEEKAAVELAADLAGLNLLGLVSDGMAVGLNYATTRNFPVVSDGEKPEYHVIFDMGAGSTTATVMRFQGKTVKDVGRFNKTIQEAAVLGSGWDKMLGGDQMNTLVLEDMVQKFMQLPEARSANINIKAFRSHGRAMAKLWKEAERVRQVLSANSEAGTLMESLYEDIDFKYKISRTEFESLTDDFGGKVSDPVKQALESSGLSFDDMDSLILYGGASRTPFVQKRLEKFAGGVAKIRSSVNADEAAVFGAAFRGASLSPSFRVKEIRSYEAASYTYGLRYDKDGKDGKSIGQSLFKPTSQVGVVKQVPFKQKEDFVFTFLETIHGRPHADPLSEIQTKNLTASVKQLVDKAGCAPEDISTEFAIQLDSYDGLPSVPSGTVSCEVEGGKGNSGSVVADVKGFFGFGSGVKNSDQEPMQDRSGDVNRESNSSESQSGTSASEPEVASNAPVAPSQDTEEKQSIPVKRVESVRIGLSVQSARNYEVPKSELKRMKERLSAFDTSDEKRRLREEKLNTLEAFTYRVRDLLEDESFITASTAAERTELQKVQSEMSEWISGGAGSHADIDVLKTEHQKLKSLVNPIEFRKSEATKRPEMVKMLQDNLEQAKNVASMIKTAMEKAAEEAKEAAASENSDTDPIRGNDDVSDPPGSAGNRDDNNNDQNAPPAPPSSSSIYSDQDLSSVTSTYNEITAWLTEKQAAQNQLLDSADPVLLTADIEGKARKLNDVALAMLQRQMRAQQKQQRQQKLKQEKKSSGKGDDKESEQGEKADENKEEEAEMPREDEKVGEKGDDTNIHLEL